MSVGQWSRFTSVFTWVVPTMTMWTPSKVITMQSFKDLALLLSKKKAMLKKKFSNEKIY